MKAPEEKNSMGTFTFGYLDPNGAGKTTTIRMLFGLFKADSGNLEILGSDINDSKTLLIF